MYQNHQVMLPKRFSVLFYTDYTKHKSIFLSQLGGFQNIAERKHTRLLDLAPKQRRTASWLLTNRKTVQ